MTLAAGRELGGEFGASLTATLIKTVQSNRFPLVIVCHDEKRRRWFRRADMVPAWWYPAEQLDRATFAADMLFNGAAEQNWPRKAARRMVNFRNCDRFEVEEQSFMLPGDEVLRFSLFRWMVSAEYLCCGTIRTNALPDDRDGEEETSERIPSCGSLGLVT